MKSIIPNNETTKDAIQQLLNDKHYVGEVKSKGFLIKRNYGVRRQPILGVANNKNQIEIKVKNELAHQVVYIFGLLIMSMLSLFTLFQGSFIITIVTIIIVSLIYAADKHQKNKEIKELLSHLKVD